MTVRLDKNGAQGDIAFFKAGTLPGFDKIPEGVIEQGSKEGKHVLSHSETGHNHWVDSDALKLFTVPNDPFTCYLRVDAEFADVVHARSFDQHETLQLTKGEWMLKRQQEHGPLGWRAAQD